jgi:MFS family permease
VASGDLGNGACASPAKDILCAMSSPIGSSPAGTQAAPGRWRALVQVATAELLIMGLWFSASAVAPALTERWELGHAAAAWLTTAVQFGFVAGTALAAVLNLADLIPARVYLAGAALLAAAANGGVAVAGGFALALTLRFATGFFLAGAYPPAMKMVATWFEARRGLAIGAVVGALTVGKAVPYLVRALPGATVRQVLWTASAAALLGAAVIAIGYRDGPYPFARRPFSWTLVGEVARHRSTRLATFGYLGHMWELYAMWTWVPAFLAASAASDPARSSGWVSAASFLAIAAGGAGCLWGGLHADRFGREPTVNLAMAISGACCLAIGLLFGASPWLLVPAVCVWGFFVVADSAQFSALVTEVAPRHAVGTALTLQTSAGFLLTLVTLQLVPELVATFGWRWAFPLLALGPAAGIAAIRALQRRSC